MTASSTCPELGESPTPEEWAWARDFIARRSWREAVTYREKAPHEYVVREWESDEAGSEDFDASSRRSVASATLNFYYKVRHIYWVIDKYKYWTWAGRLRDDGHQSCSRGRTRALEKASPLVRTRPALLGYLAQFASFKQAIGSALHAGTGIPAPDVQGRTVGTGRQVKARTGVSIGNGLTWLPEAVQDDGGRPDLEACTSSEIPTIKIEAKMGATLYPGQLRSYEMDLRRRNSGDSVLLVLVPKWQVAIVKTVIVETFGPPENEHWRVSKGRSSGSVAVSIISWNELFDTLRGSEGKWFRHELEQLEAMYHVLSGDFIAPLASAEDLKQWEAHEEDFLAIVDRATRRLTTQHSVYPMGPETLDGESHENVPMVYRRRYVCPCTFDKESCFAIGVRHSFAEWVTPIWMRFRSDTGNFERIRENVERSSVDFLDSSGHLWIPLHLPFNASGEEMIQAVVEQADEVLWIAYGAG